MYLSMLFRIMFCINGQGKLGINMLLFLYLPHPTSVSMLGFAGRQHKGVCRSIVFLLSFRDKTLRHFTH